MKKIIKYLTHPREALICLMNKNFFFFLPDKLFLKWKFKILMGYKLDLNNPQTFNEKLQWLKLYDRKPTYTKMVDKYEAKEYVKNIIGEEHIIKTLGIYNSFEEIDFEKLPNQFVIKPTHTSGDVYICTDKSNINYKELENKIKKWLKRKYFYIHREWPYKNVERKIIAEKYMADNSNSSQLTDYKVYTFNGRAKMIMINKDRGVDTKADYFDTDYQCLDFFWGYPHAEVKPQKPKCFDEMIELAEKLAKDTYELRVDFYEVNGQIYFGEMTFFDAAGFGKFEPNEWDKKIGDMLKLPMEEEK